MANRRWTENNLLTIFNNFALLITDMNESVDRVGKHTSVFTILTR